MCGVCGGSSSGGGPGPAPSGGVFATTPDQALHIVAMTITPADEEAGPIGHEVAIQAKRVAPKLKVVKADQHYTRKNDTFVRPLREEGWEIVMNQSSDEQKRVRLITAGKHDTPLLIHCGTPLPPWTPPHRLNPPDDLTGGALQDWYNERAKYQWRGRPTLRQRKKETHLPPMRGPRYDHRQNPQPQPAQPHPQPRPAHHRRPRHRVLLQRNVEFPPCAGHLVYAAV